MKRRNSIPQPTKRKDGRAVVRLHGTDYYLGRYGSPEAKEKYRLLVAEYLRGGLRPKDPVTPGREYLVEDLILDWWEANAVRLPCSARQDEYRRIFRPLRKLFGRTPCRLFGPKSLKAVREDWIHRNVNRKKINHAVRQIVRLFAWAVEEERIQPMVWHALTCVRNLRAGEGGTEPVRVPPVPDAIVEQTLPFLHPFARSAVRLLRLTGMRCGELFKMKPGMLDRTGSIWRYRIEQHKTAASTGPKILFLGRQSQEILSPLIEGLTPHEPVWTTARGDVSQREFRGQQRVSPMTPSQRQRAKRAARRRTGNEFRGVYTSAVLGRLLLRVCSREGIPGWHLHQLRHTKACEVRQMFGLEAAQVMLGHSRADVTQIYAERDLVLAEKVADQTG
jgi:integrase